MVHLRVANFFSLGRGRLIRFSRFPAIRTRGRRRGASFGGLSNLHGMAHLCFRRSLMKFWGTQPQLTFSLSGFGSGSAGATAVAAGSALICGGL
jgi:hypothetical protein